MSQQSLNVHMNEEIFTFYRARFTDGKETFTTKETLETTNKRSATSSLREY